MARIERIEMKIIWDDGEEVEAQITGEYGYHQWGNTPEVLWRSVELIESIGNQVDFASGEEEDGDFENEE